MFLRGERPFRMSGSCLQALPDVQKAPPVVREWSGDPYECPGVVGRLSRISGVVGRPCRLSGVVGTPSQMFCSCREALRMTRRPSQMSRSGWETLADVREWSGGLPGCPGVAVRHSRISRSGREALPDVQEWSRGPP